MSQIPPLKITENEGDTLQIILDPNKHPLAYQRKVSELIQQGMTQCEAEIWLMQSPIILELFYSMDQGLFAVESEATTCCDIYNPYTGIILPNDNIIYQAEDNLKKLDRITCDLSNIKDELETIQGWNKLTADGEEVLEDTINHLDDTLTEIHKFTDPDDKVGLIDD